MALTFDASTHTYRLDGKIIPSTTEVLGAAGLKPASYGEIDPRVMDDARTRGKSLHGYLEADLTNAPLPGYPSEWQGYVDAWESFKKATRLECEASERMLCLPKWMVAGTLDFKGWVHVGGKRYRAIIDWKFTSRYHPCSQGPQIAVYHQMDLVASPDAAATHGFVALFNRRGGYSLNQVDLPANWRVAQAAMTLYWHKRKHGEINGKEEN